MPTAPAAAPRTRETAEAVIRTLLLTDLVDSTRLVEKLGDARAYEVATRHDRVSRDLLPRYGGLEIDKTDGFLLLFERPLDAVGYALAYHQALAGLSVELGVQLRSRAGIHLGEVFLRENRPEDVARGAKPLEVEGLAKPTAARAMSLAGAKQTLLTQSAFDLAREAAVAEEAFGGKLRWLAHGPYLFKGVDEPVEIFEVGVEGAAPLAPPADTAKVRRAVAAGDEVTLGWRPGPGLEIPRRAGWLLEKRLGEGGFGEVWLAIQRSTAEPRVFKFCYDAERLRALQREVTLFRLLKESLGDAAEIQRIYDWNLDQAPYYTEAEYVAGGDLVEWASARGGLAEIPLADRLEIVAQVADALAAAHSVGVLHKDVKPGNVLMTAAPDGRPRAKLTDFGIGEVLDQRQLLARGITVLGMTEVVAAEGSSSVTGSRLYMAPEVSEGKAATVQADIYALGVMLYQVVAGDFQRALAPGWRRDVDDELLAEDIGSFVDGAPEHRPASAHQVAERLRGLDTRRAERAAELRAREEAEAARLALERAQRRRKISAVIAAAATVFLVVVSVFAIQAMLARDEAEAARGVADQRRSQAEDLISFMLGDLREKLEPVGRLEILDGVGEKAMEYFSAVPEEELSDEELSRRSRALYQIGDVRVSQGDLGAALGPFKESQALAQRLVDRAPDDGKKLFELAQSHFWLGFVHSRRGEPKAALDQFRIYLEISERLMGIDAENQDWQLELAYAHTNLATVFRATGAIDRALEHVRLSNEIKRRLVSLDPSNIARRRSLANGLSWLATILRQNGDLPEALEQRRDELEMREALAKQEPPDTHDSYLLSLSHSHASDLLLATGRPKDALSHSEAALHLIEELATKDPTNTRWGWHLALFHMKQGNVLRALSPPKGTGIHYRTGRRILKELVATDPTNTEWQRDLGILLYFAAAAKLAGGPIEKTLSGAREALAILEPILRANPDDRSVRSYLALTYVLLGRIHRQLGRPADASDAWSRAVEIIEPFAIGSGDPRLLEPWARALLHLGRRDQASSIVDSLAATGYASPDFLALCRENELGSAVIGSGST